MLQWLHNLSPGQATFLGSLTGASIGLIALLLGALFNAHLDRRRDDRLRREEQRTVAAALQAELVGWHDRLQSTISLMTSESEFPLREIPKLTARLFPEIISKLGFLPSDTIGSVIAAYNQADWYSWRLSHAAQSDHEAMFPATYVALAQETIDIITPAITQLDHLLAGITRTWREMSWGERWRWLRTTG